MTKSPDAFKTISEVADELKLPQHVLRFWETRFSQIKPMKRGGGRRYYRPDDLSLLRGIRHLLYSEGYTIKGVQRILKEQGARYVATQWLDAGEEQPVPQAERSAEVSASVEASPAAIPVPPTATMPPVGQSVEPVAVAPTAPVMTQAQASATQATPAPTADISTPKPATIDQAAQVTPVAPVTPAAHVTPVAPVASVAQVTSAAPAAPVLPQQAPPAVDQAPQAPQPQVAAAPVQPAAPQRQAVMPPFAVTHGAPAHLVDAITPTSSLVETVAYNDDDTSNRRADNVPADILADGEKSGGIAKSIGMGLLGKIKGSDDGDARKNAQSILPKGDVERLQATLVDLLECKRLLDQIR